MFVYIEGMVVVVLGRRGWLRVKGICVVVGEIGFLGCVCLVIFVDRFDFRCLGFV